MSALVGMLANDCVKLGFGSCCRMTTPYRYGSVPFPSRPPGRTPGSTSFLLWPTYPEIVAVAAQLLPRDAASRSRVLGTVLSEC